MNYALIENNIIKNIIWLYPNNANDFPNAVPTNNKPVNIGDTYKDGEFWRDGEKILSAVEFMTKELGEAEAIIAELDTVLLNTTYENIIGGLE